MIALNYCVPIRRDFVTRNSCYSIALFHLPLLFNVCSNVISHSLSLNRSISVGVFLFLSLLLSVSVFLSVFGVYFVRNILKPFSQCSTFLIYSLVCPLFLYSCLYSRSYSLSSFGLYSRLFFYFSTPEQSTSETSSSCNYFQCLHKLYRCKCERALSLINFQISREKHRNMLSLVQTNNKYT